MIDTANKMQDVICFVAWIKKFICNEDFIRLYVVDSISSDSIVHNLKGRMILMNLKVSEVNGTIELLTWPDTEME